MNAKTNEFVDKLNDKTLVLFFTAGVSLKTWLDLGSLDREEQKNDQKTRNNNPELERLEGDGRWVMGEA